MTDRTIERADSRLPDEQEINDDYRDLMTVRERFQLRNALNNQAVNAQLDEIQRNQDRQNESIIVNASILREMTIQERAQGLTVHRSRRAMDYQQVLDITGTRSRRLLHDTQMQSVSDTLNLSQRLVRTGDVERGSQLREDIRRQFERHSSRILAGLPQLPSPSLSSTHSITGMSRLIVPVQLLMAELRSISGVTIEKRLVRIESQTRLE